MCSESHQPRHSVADEVEGAGLGLGEDKSVGETLDAGGPARGGKEGSTIEIEGEDVFVARPVLVLGRHRLSPSASEF